MFSNLHHRVPLCEAISEHLREGVVPFHTPGHKQGIGLDDWFRDFVRENILKADLTEIPGLDDLHQPSGPIAHAQRLAADLFGADRSFFLVNGTTAGVYAMILSACGPGEELVIPRNVHRSVMGAVILGDIRPVYMMPEFDHDWGIPLEVTPDMLRGALSEHPEAKAVLVTNPGIYGLTPDLVEIIRVARSRGVMVLVDEAYGAHLRFHPELPLCAMDAGADASAQGIHKMLASFTQASLLHVKGNRIDISRLKAMLQMVQTTSPSYLLMMSLDAARRQMALHGQRLVSRAVELACMARSRIDSIPGLRCFGRGEPSIRDKYGLDPLKLTINVARLGLTGFQAAVMLRQEYGIQVEFADPSNILALITLADSEDTVEKLVHSLEQLASKAKSFLPTAKSQKETTLLPAKLPEQIYTPREAVFAARRRLPLDEAVGWASAEVIVPYPPGIPVICPGERLDSQLIEWIKTARAAGFHFQGPEDPSLDYLWVVDKPPRKHVG